jgi:hypothetical protein
MCSCVLRGCTEFQLLSRMPIALPRDLRVMLLEFLGMHASTQLRRALHALFYSSPRLARFRRARRWMRELRWEHSSVRRRVRLGSLYFTESIVLRDPRGAACGNWYDFARACWCYEPFGEGVILSDPLSNDDRFNLFFRTHLAL